MTNLIMRLLGPFQVEVAGDLAVRFASDKVRALLAYLATEPDKPHRRDRLAGLLWPNTPQKTARTNLRRALADLRKAIGDHHATPPFLIITRQTIQFNSLSNVWVDVYVFTSPGSGPATQSAVDRSIEQLEEAVALYRGHFLEGLFVDDSLAFEEWALLKRERYQRQALLLLHRLAAHYEKSGEYARAVPHAWRQVELDPLQEPAQRQIMRLLANTDQRAAALSQYESLRRLLSEELGMAPAKRTTALYEKILEGNPNLAISMDPGVRGYRLHEQIGVGRHGAVYRAVQTTIGREVAVKVIQPQYANRPDFIRRFEAEAQLVAGLEHPFIVPLYDYWREPDGAFLVMRWLRRGSLQAALENGPWSLDAAVSLIEQITDALSVAHQQGIVHRDIKPANILLDDYGNAYLSDFGIAKDSAWDFDQEQPEDITGSPTIISPEQTLNEPITPLTDLFSLGLVLWELLTGVHPFAGLTMVEIRHQCLYETIPPAKTRCPDLPSAVDDVIQRATARKPTERYPDAPALAADFRKAVSTGGIGLAPPATAPVKTSLVNPYRGLHAFQEADADVFYGRTAFIEQLLSRLTENRFLAVVGPSGSGKSSAVKAGLIPCLRQGAIPGSEGWFIVEMTPGLHPMAELETALMPIAVNPPPSLREPLKKDDQGLSRVLNRILPANHDGEHSQVLLLIDQFEELFTLVEDSEERSHFLDSLLHALHTSPGRLRVVVTLRADFYDRPLQYPPLAQLLRQHTELALPLTRAELEQAICSPATSAGVKVEPQLTVSIMADVQAQPGALPLLQYALTELFERREGSTMTLAAFQEIGGVTGALSRRAEELYAALDESGQAETRQLFLRLITLGDGVSDTNESPDTRRRALRSELEALSTTGESRSGTDYISPITEYGRYRLLTFDRDPTTRSPTVEVAHESLLREWPRLRRWLDKSRADVRQQRLLASAAEEWRTADRDEGFLLHGARLDQFSGWVETSTVALTSQEQDFLSASQAARQERKSAEETRRQRELETVRQLADTERQRAEEQSRLNQRLRWRALLLGGALFIAAILAVLANNATHSARENALAAEISAQLAKTREAEALTEAEQRAAAEAIAVQERGEAQEQGRQAQARALAGAAVSNMQVDPELSVLLALQAVEITYAVDGTWAPEAVDALHHTVGAASRLQNILVHPGGAMNGIRYSPDGTMLGASTLLAGQEIMATVWNAKTGEELLTLPTSIARFSEDSKRLMTWHASGFNLIWETWDIASVEKVQTVDLFIEDLGLSSGGALSRDWHYFAVRYVDGSVNVWQMESNDKILHSAEHTDMINWVEFSPDNRYLATASRDGTAKVWSVPTDGAVLNGNAESLLTLQHADSVQVLAFSADSRYLATVSSDFTAVIWDLTASITEGSPVTLFTFPLTGHAEQVTQVIFSFDGSLLAVVSQDGLVKVWDTATGEGVLSLVSNEHTRSIAFSPEGTHLVTANDGGLVEIWDITPGGEKEWLTLTGHAGAVNQAAYSLDGAQLATVSSDETVKLWDADSGELLKTLTGHTGNVRAVTFSSDGTRLATASNDRTIRLWDAADGKELSRFDVYAGLPLNPIPDNNILDVAFTPDDTRLLSVGMDNLPEIWDVAKGEQVTELNGHWYNVVSLAISPDGQHMATTGPDGFMIVWNIHTGEQIFNQRASVYGSRDVVFSPDGGRIATGDNDGAVRIWELNAEEEERLVFTLSGHGSSVHAVDFSPDGRFLASASATLIRIWDMETGRSLFTLPGHTRVVLDIEFSPNGTRLVSTSADGTVRIFILPIEELMSLARSRLTRSLTDEECQQYLQMESCSAVP